MSNSIQGLKKALAATRSKNRELQQQIQLLTNIVEKSNMSGMLRLIELSKSYSGGMFERLGFKSQLLTAIAWSNYPNKSFTDLLQSTEKFCPELAQLFGKYGINFAVIAPLEPDPAEDKVWQLAYDFVGAKARHKGLRIYSLELFLEIPDQSVVFDLYTKHREDLEEAVNQFEEKAIQEVIASIESDYNLSLLSLEELCLPC